MSGEPTARSQLEWTAARAARDPDRAADPDRILGNAPFQQGFSALSPGQVGIYLGVLGHGGVGHGARAGADELPPDDVSATGERMARPGRQRLRPGRAAAIRAPSSAWCGWSSTSSSAMWRAYANSLLGLLVVVVLFVIYRR